MQAVEVVTLMTAVSLYTVCQDLDLRVLHRIFVEWVAASVEPVTAQWLMYDPGVENSSSQEKGATLRSRVKTVLQSHWPDTWASTGALDLRPRCQQLVDSAVSKLLLVIADMNPSPTMENLAWRVAAIDVIWRTWTETWEFKAAPPTVRYLGGGSHVLYRYIRDTLSVPFFQGSSSIRLCQAWSSTVGRRERSESGSRSLPRQFAMDGSPVQYLESCRSYRRKTRSFMACMIYKLLLWSCGSIQ